MATSVVTGAAGFLGSHLREYLLEKGHRVTCLNNLDTGTLENVEHLRDNGLTFRAADVSEFIDVAEPVDNQALPTDDPKVRRPDITRATAGLTRRQPPSTYARSHP